MPNPRSTNSWQLFPAAHLMKRPSQATCMGSKPRISQAARTSPRTLPRGSSTWIVTRCHPGDFVQRAGRPATGQVVQTMDVNSRPEQRQDRLDQGGAVAFNRTFKLQALPGRHEVKASRGLVVSMTAESWLCSRCGFANAGSIIRSTSSRVSRPPAAMPQQHPRRVLGRKRAGRDDPAGRIAFQDAAVHERTGVPLVRIADDVFILAGRLRDRRPFQPGRVTRATAPRNHESMATFDWHGGAPALGAPRHRGAARCARTMPARLVFPIRVASINSSRAPSDALPRISEPTAWDREAGLPLPQPAGLAGAIRHPPPAAADGALESLSFETWCKRVKFGCVCMSKPRNTRNEKGNMSKLISAMTPAWNTNGL